MLMVVVVVWEVVLHADDDGDGVGGCNMLMVEVWLCYMLMMVVVWEVVLHADGGGGVGGCVTC